MKLKMKNVCTHWIFLSMQYSRMYCTYDFLQNCAYMCTTILHWHGDMCMCHNVIHTFSASTTPSLMTTRIAWMWTCVYSLCMLLVYLVRVHCVFWKKDDHSWSNGHGDNLIVHNTLLVHWAMICLKHSRSGKTFCFLEI